MSTTGMEAGQARVIDGLGIAQTLAWGSSYYLPAIPCKRA
jgi:hypothetical protein